MLRWGAYALVLGVALIGVAPAQADAQVNLIVNGDFENNTAATCEFNLTNSEFNAKMANVTAFGTAQEIDIMKGQCGVQGSVPQSGTTKIAIHTKSQAEGGAFDAFSFQLSQPLIAGATYTLQFYAQTVLQFDPDIAAVEVGLSNSDTSFGTLIFSGVPSTEGWTQFTHTFIAPFDATFLTVRNDLTKEVWNHLDNFSLAAPALPDLIVESLTHSPASPTTADTITFTAVVKNIGSAIAGASTLDFKVGGETFGQNFNIPSLEPGASHTVQRQEILTVAQNYQNTATADANNAVAESNEDNNVTTDFYVVVAQTITTVASGFNLPLGVAVDNGNLYVPDRRNHVVWKIDWQVISPVMTVVAGTGAPGFNGDFGGDGNSRLATDAKLRGPSGVALFNGSLYIADTGNHRIRKVDASGHISTVAGSEGSGFSGDGGAATLARLDTPTDIAVDPVTGDLYIADSVNQRVRKVATGTITTLVGTGTAGFVDGDLDTVQVNDPRGVETDAAGNVYIADTGNNRIRRLGPDPESEAIIITTVAGTGTPGFLGDSGPATGAQLNVPTNIAIDAAGNLYIADSNNNRIRKVHAGSGMITTVAGNGAPDASGGAGDGGPAIDASLTPVAVTVDAANRLFAVDPVANRVRKID